MATTPIITNRGIKNIATGIDISVPTVKEISGRLLTDEEFHVIVITNKSFFKPLESKPSDSVQFMVPKRYNQIEGLHKALSEKFPATILPNLPKKLLLMKDSTISERRISFDKLMKSIAQNPKICCSSIVLTFLGLSKEQITVAEQRNAKESTTEQQEEQLNTKDQKSFKPKEELNLFAVTNEDEDDDDDLNLFGGSSQLTKVEHKQINDKAKDEGPIQDELIRLMRAADPKPLKPKIKESSLQLFEEQDYSSEPVESEGADIFLPADTVDKGASHESMLIHEDNSELLNIEDDIDQLFVNICKKNKIKPTIASKPQSMKPSLAPKPTISTKPMKPADKPPTALKPDRKTLKSDTQPSSILDGNSLSVKDKTTKSIYDDLFSESTTAEDNLNDDDIMKYILDNSGREEVSLDLF